jgi:hypothetical protein
MTEFRLDADKAFISYDGDTIEGVQWTGRTPDLYDIRVWLRKNTYSCINETVFRHQGDPDNTVVFVSDSPYEDRSLLFTAVTLGGDFCVDLAESIPGDLLMDLELPKQDNRLVWGDGIKLDLGCYANQNFPVQVVDVAIIRAYLPGAVIAIPRRKRHSSDAPWRRDRYFSASQIYIKH